MKLWLLLPLFLSPFVAQAALTQTDGWCAVEKHALEVLPQDPDSLDSYDWFTANLVTGLECPILTDSQRFKECLPTVQKTYDCKCNAEADGCD